MWAEFSTGRGSPADFDPGPPQPWADLFAQTPNYRGLGLAFSGDQFRWHFGPMFYRGRLTPGTARVLVIGQEGAADESLSHRSFTGETGSRMQHFLNHLGINRSYLFLNTFVYPINGQYDGGFPTLAQDPRSPIVAHRSRLLDLAAGTHELRLVVAVGKAAKESCATWLAAHGGTGDPDKLQQADASVIRPGLRMVGVPHPGGASAGGSLTTIVAGFKAASQQVGSWVQQDPGWLPVDPGAVRGPAGGFTYLDDAVPFADFPFGIAWRLGATGTSSGRKDAQSAIELSSSDGKNSGDVTRYVIPAGSATGYEQDAGDVEFEPPRHVPMGYDPGPGEFAALLAGTATGLDWPDFRTLGLAAHPSFGFGPSYRGRLAHPAVLVLADQASHDDLFTMRALTGEAGQRLQGWLLAAGLDRSYAILRTLPVDSLDAPPAAVQAATDSPQVRAILAAVIARSAPAVVVALGPGAQRIAGAVVPAGVPVVRMPAWSSGATAAWRAALTELGTHPYPKDVAASGSWNGRRSQISRIDLPYGMLRWQGTGGDRAGRATIDGQPSHDHYKFALPRWAAALEPAPLSASEQAAVDALKS